MTFPDTQAPIAVQIAPGADLSDPSGWTWVDVTADVRAEAGVTISGGRRDEGATVDTTNCTVTLDNTAGNYTPRNPLGTWYGQLSRNTPLRVRWSTTDRFVGYVAEWPARWDLSGTNATAEVVATGILRRLSQGPAAVDSPLYRAQTALAPIAYWPLEDAETATQAGSALSGGFPLRVEGFTFAGDSSHPGSAPLPTLDPGSSYSGRVQAAAGTGGWTVTLAFKMEQPTNANAIIYITTSGLARLIKVTAGPGNALVIAAYDDDGVLLDDKSNSGTPHFGTDWGLLVIGGDQTGSTVNYQLSRHLPGESSGFTVFDVDQTGTAGTVTGVYLPTRGSGAETFAMGHLAVHDFYMAVSSPEIDTLDAAMVGFTGETAQDRMTRLCTEAGVPFDDLGGDPADTATMGAQGSGDLLDLLHGCETADGGLLHELDGGLAYQSRVARYNQPVALALDADAGHLAQPPEPTDDDQLTTNDVTASRPEGSSSRYVDVTGPLGTSTIGTYDTATDVNVADDAQLQDVAAWLVHLGTVDEARWPSVSLDFSRSPALLTDWLALQVGHRVTVDQSLPQLTGTTIDVLVDGWTETITPYGYTADLNCVPATPWDTAELEDATLGRLDTDGSTLAASTTSSGQTLQVATTDLDTPAWTTDPTQPPFDLMLGGEQVTVSNITGDTSDLFNRSAANGWGTANSGQVWTVSGGAAANFAVTAGVGRVGLTGVGTRHFTLSTSSYDAVEILATLTCPVLATGGDIGMGILARATDTSNHYMLQALFRTTGVVRLQFQKRAAGTYTNLSAGSDRNTYTAGQVFNLRARWDGQAMQARLWPAGSLEPGGWGQSATDATYTTGLLGTHSALFSGNTNTQPVNVDYDSLQTVNRQVIVVTRSVNGVVKTHPAGRAVTLAHPMVLAR